MRGCDLAAASPKVQGLQIVQSGGSSIELTSSARPPRSRIRRVIHSIPSLCNPFVRRPIQDADGLFSLIVDVIVGDPLVLQHSPHLQLQTMIGPG